LCQRFLRDLRKERLRFPRLAKFHPQQENSCPTLFAGVELLRFFARYEQLRVGVPPPSIIVLQSNAATTWGMLQQ
jgi:hypothetical protein